MKEDWGYGDDKYDAVVPDREGGKSYGRSQRVVT